MNSPEAASSGKSPAPSGVFALNKARGETSAKAAAAVRKMLGAKKAGHGGALDPLADGLVVVLLGDATPLARFALAGNKTYRAAIRFGFATDTDDAEGQPLAPAQKPDLTRLPEILPQFTGEFQQDAPRHSALKHQGRPLYYYARRGLQAPVKRRTAKVFALQLLRADQDSAELMIRCASGFYVRSLARDLGEKMKCGAHLAALTRTESGNLKLSDAVSLAQLGETEPARRTEFILPPEAAVSHLPPCVLHPAQILALANGAGIPLTDVEGLADVEGGNEDGAEALLRAPDGRFAGAGKVSEGELRPLAMMPWTRTGGGKGAAGKRGKEGKRGGRAKTRRGRAGRNFEKNGAESFRAKGALQ